MIVVRNKTFKYNNILSVPDELPGIYSFWFNGKCIYVGETTKQSLQKRLLNHYLKCHNNCLKNWINSRFNIYFNFEAINDSIIIKEKEEYLIKFWDPVCNIKGRKK